MPNEDVQYIATQADLSAWVERLETADVVAVDTESDSFHRYREKVCLIQMTALGQDVIIDPLALGDISSLAPLFACSRRIKIFHDAGYDLVCLQRDFGFAVTNIFDTMLAGRITGSRHFGLAAMLQRYFAFTADKRYQRSDWSKRPLTEAQLSYARYDTHFLPRLRLVLLEELQASGRLAWAQEEFARLPELAAAVRQLPKLADEDGFWRIHGAKNFSPVVRGRLQQLYMARERIAERLDRPAFKVLGDNVLVELAENPPACEDAFAPMPGLRRHAIERYGPQLLAAMAQAQPVEGPPPKHNRRRRSGRTLDPDARERYEALRVVRRCEADALGLEPEVVLSNAVLEMLARLPPTSRAELAALAAFRGWRADVLVDGFYACVQSFGEAQAPGAAALALAPEALVPTEVAPAPSRDGST